LRKELFEGTGEIPVLIGSWTPEQERKILATLDPIGAMATQDAAALDTLLQQIGDGMTEEASKALVASLRSENDLALLRLASATDAAADGQFAATVADGSEVEYKTFMTPVTLDQERIIRQAVALAKDRGDLESTGDALSLIARTYLHDADA
jgi:hypothetical protein